MFTSPSGRFTPRGETHSTHWIWCWLGLRPRRKALEKETSISCRKLDHLFLFFHHVTSTITQTATSNYYYYTLIKAWSSSAFGVPYCASLQNTLIRIFLYNTIFWTPSFLQHKGLCFIPYKRQKKADLNAALFCSSDTTRHDKQRHGSSLQLYKLIWKSALSELPSLSNGKALQHRNIFCHNVLPIQQSPGRRCLLGELTVPQVVKMSPIFVQS
jgi:hypothetical protein